MLGVTAWTVWSWRRDYPEIDEAIAAESQDYLASTRHGLASLLPLTQQALELALTSAPEFKDRIAAAKVVLELFKGIPTPAQNAMLERARELADSELDAVIDATAEPR